MSGWDDLHGVTPPRISPEDAERLLSGAPGADAIHDFAEINAVFDALRGPAEPAELQGLHSALVAFGAAVVTTQPDPSTARTRPMIRKLLTGKAIATIGVVTLISAGAAAAAGVVPTPFSASRPLAATSTEHEADDDSDSTDETLAGVTTSSSEVSTTESTEVDAAKAAAADAAETTDSTDSTDGEGPDVNGPAKFGLCTAYAARTKHDDTTTTTEAAATPPAEPVTTSADSDLPVPFQALSDAADAAGQSVADFCADAVPDGSADAPGKSADNPSATAPGKSADNPSATAPGKSADNPSATAPGKPDNNPPVTATGEPATKPSATAPGKPDNPGGGHGKP